jgi:hypothetical protein
MGFSGFFSRFVPEIRDNAPATFRQAGFQIIGYRGYMTTPFSGGNAWFTLRRIGGDTTITYTASVEKWYSQYHIYDLRAIDAIRP